MGTSLPAIGRRPQAEARASVVLPPRSGKKMSGSGMSRQRAFSTYAGDSMRPTEVTSSKVAMRGDKRADLEEQRSRSEPGGKERDRCPLADDPWPT